MRAMTQITEPLTRMSKPIGQQDFCGQALRPPLKLQQILGNQAALRLLGGGVLRAKLVAGTPDDAYEEEADSMAEEAIRAAPEPVQRRCACGGVSGPAGECAECRANRLARQGQPVSSAVPSAAPQIVQEVLRSPGRPLNPVTRAFMESQFGHDFGRVRVHTDSRAAESARAVNALAYTVGKDIIFAEGLFSPETPCGKRLLAHELTHTVQQGDQLTNPGGDVRISAPGDNAEHEAERTSEEIAQGQRAMAFSGVPIQIACRVRSGDVQTRSNDELEHGSGAVLGAERAWAIEHPEGGAPRTGPTA